MFKYERNKREHVLQQLNVFLTQNARNVVDHSLECPTQLVPELIRDEC